MFSVKICLFLSGLVLHSFIFSTNAQHCEVSKGAFCATEMCFRVFPNVSIDNTTSIRPSADQKVGCMDRDICEENLGMGKNVCLPISMLKFDRSAPGAQYGGIIQVLREYSPGILCCCSKTVANCDPSGMVFDLPDSDDFPFGNTTSPVDVTESDTKKTPEQQEGDKDSSAKRAGFHVGIAFFCPLVILLFNLV